MFALLGHNGAGKTTTIRMLTSQLAPSAGDVLLCPPSPIEPGTLAAVPLSSSPVRSCAGSMPAGADGASAVDDPSVVERMIGLCPQHDVLYESLTAYQHLWLHGRLKGVARADLKVSLQPSRPPNPLPVALTCARLLRLAARRLDCCFKVDIERLLVAVKLEGMAHHRAGSYSGGMKRRLSVAMAYVGQPRVVVLDEPTTGMDPYNRKFVWQMINERREGRTPVLTTHSMEEADALGSTIAIMSAGRLVALGSSVHLKSTFGSGYSVRLLSPQASVPLMKAKVAELLPEAKLIDDAAGSLCYGISLDVVPKAAALLQYIEKLQASSAAATVDADSSEAARSAAAADQPVITDWLISYSTLEDVFIRLARSEESPRAEETPAAEAASSPTATAAGSGLQPVDSAAGVDASAIELVPVRVSRPNAPGSLRVGRASRLRLLAANGAPSEPQQGGLLSHPENAASSGGAAPIGVRLGIKGGKSRPFAAAMRKNGTLMCRKRCTVGCNLVLPLIVLIAALLIKQSRDKAVERFAQQKETMVDLYATTRIHATLPSQTPHAHTRVVILRLSAPVTGTQMAVRRFKRPMTMRALLAPPLRAAPLVLATLATKIHAWRNTSLPVRVPAWRHTRTQATTAAQARGHSVRTVTRPRPSAVVQTTANARNTSARVVSRRRRLGGQLHLHLHRRLGGHLHLHLHRRTTLVGLLCHLHRRRTSALSIYRAFSALRVTQLTTCGVDACRHTTPNAMNHLQMRRT